LVDRSVNCTVSGEVPWAGSALKSGAGGGGRISKPEGRAAAFTRALVIPDGSDPDFPSVFATTTVQLPVDFPVRSKVQFILDELMTVTLVAVTGDWPIFVSCTEAPERNPVPLIAVMATGPLFDPRLGVMEVIVGAGFSTMKPFARRAFWPSGFRTTIFQGPVLAPARFRVQVIVAGSTTVVPEAMISASPIFDIFTVAPGRKLDPVRFVTGTAPLLMPDEGLTELTDGAGFMTPKAAARLPSWPSLSITTTSHDPVAFPVRFSVQVILMGLITVTFVAVMSG
jgi:hypothetical protein